MLLRSKCFFFHDIFKTIQNSFLVFPKNSRFWSKYRKRCHNLQWGKGLCNHLSTVFPWLCTRLHSCFSELVLSIYLQNLTLSNRLLNCVVLHFVCVLFLTRCWHIWCSSNVYMGCDFSCLCYICQGYWIWNININILSGFFFLNAPTPH